MRSTVDKKKANYFPVNLVRILTEIVIIGKIGDKCQRGHFPSSYETGEIIEVYLQLLPGGHCNILSGQLFLPVGIPSFSLSLLRAALALFVPIPKLFLV